MECQKKKGRHTQDSGLLKETEQVLFKKLEQDYEDVKGDIEEQAGTV